MKIANVTPIVVSTPPPHRGGRNWVFAKLTADDGTEGIGETYKVPFHPLNVARLIEDIGKTWSAGQDSGQFGCLGFRRGLGSNQFVNRHAEHARDPLHGLDRSRLPAGLDR